MHKLYVSVLELLNNCMMHNYRVITIYRTCLKIFFAISQDFSAPDPSQYFHAFKVGRPAHRPDTPVQPMQCTCL